MTKKAKYFIADGLLKATGKSEGDDHYSHTDNGCRYR
jgi:hypothetical protein